MGGPAAAPLPASSAHSWAPVAPQRGGGGREAAEPAASKVLRPDTNFLEDDWDEE